MMIMRQKDKVAFEAGKRRAVDGGAAAERQREAEERKGSGKPKGRTRGRW